jgi:hypothetical protein
MFRYDQGFGPGKWLWWFVGLMSAYGVLTLFPENAVAAKIGGLLAIAEIAVVRYRVARTRKS